ncbi:MAG: TonB-dependent Receptor Plug Domain protein [Bacteroidetes bacterium ADurb.BinA174]|nr:MAG: TonB-dependent Receptor Plug Domain protein [Bacteroidetes bacterium ADurb.BinA174]
MGRIHFKRKVIVLVSLLFFSLSVSSAQKISLNFNKKNLKTVLESISHQTGYSLAYSKEVINLNDKVSIKANQVELEMVLERLLTPRNLSYEIIEDKIYILYKAPERKTEIGGTNEITQQNQPVGQQISGMVTDENGVPIIGANISVVGSTIGTVTDIDGHYSLNVPRGSVLRFSYIGFVNQEFTITNQTTLNVQMSEDVEMLQEVVVIGYGTQRITKVSGAISTIKSEDIVAQKPVRVEEALQGRASGINVIQNGSPGSKPTVLIRGIPSFTGTDPVVIIDGVPQTLNDFNALNAADIASVNVLKDAASTAIYGVKGGNGVIVVTTKSGRKDQKPVITVNSNFGSQQVMKKIGVLNATEYATILNEGSVAAGGSLIFPDISVVGLGTDWQDQIFKTAPASTNNISVTGGSENVRYFLSSGYLTQGGIVGGKDKSRFNRLNATANFDIQIVPKLLFTLNTSYVNIKSKGVQENSFNSVIGSALNFDPTVPILNPFYPEIIGKYGFSNLLLSEIFNPLTKLDNTYNKGNGNKLYGKAELQYEIIKNLKVTSRLGYVYYNYIGKSFTPLVFYGPRNVENTMNADGSTVTGKHNSVGESHSNTFSFTHETFANYDFTLNDLHNFETTLGYSMSRSKSQGFDVARQDVPFNSWEFADISSATGVNSATNTNAQTGSSWQGLTRRNLSYFGRVNYDYKDKYLASFSLRRDGSIAFGKDNKFANFFAGSFGWVVSQEDFYKAQSWMDFLKFRVSYGSIGNENVSPQYVEVVTGGPSYNQTANSNGYTFGDLFVPGSTINSFRNDILRWEKQLQFNAGFDLRLFSKVSFSADYFDKRVDGLLFRDAAPLYAGTSIPVDANIGSTKSQGFDLTLGYNDEFFDELRFYADITFTTSKNIVTATNRDGTAFIPGGSFFNGQSQSVTRFEKGYTPGYFYGFKTEGLFQNYDEIANSPKQTGAVPGDIKFADLNDDNVINDLDKTKIGDPFPTFTSGINLGAEYKGFDFNVFTYISYGNDIYRAYERNAQYSNKFRNILNRWTGEGTTNDARFPRYSFSDANSNIRVSDRYVEDGSFVKIKNIVLGYTLPKQWTQNFMVSSLRIYGQVKNPLTLTRYTGYDPEIPGGILDTGVDRGSYPQARTFSVGVDIRF